MDRKANCIKERNREGEKIDLFLNVTEGDRRRERERACQRDKDSVLRVGKGNGRVRVRIRRGGGHEMWAVGLDV